jgi:hypothetical protein
MNALTLALVVSLSHLVLMQPLDVVQHTALMIVYDGLGSSSCCSSRLLMFFFRLQDAIQLCARDSVYRPIVLDLG